MKGLCWSNTLGLKVSADLDNCQERVRGPRNALPMGNLCAIAVSWVFTQKIV